ncbi:peptidase [Aureococcus anophagefferens]|nr:peptidase [Aureococcus anophagefferens]
MPASARPFPELHASFREALRILGGLRDGAVPELYVRSDPRPNAYTLAMQGGAPFVVVTSALVDGFSAAEVQAVLAHELGHLVCEHSLWFSWQRRDGLAPPLPGLGAGLEGLLQSWRRAAEFSCDRAALLVAQDPDVVNAALIKLTSGSSKDVNVEAFLEQALEYERSLGAANRLVRSAMRSSLADATHPLPVRRVAELDKFAKSTQYAAIISGGTPLA